MPRLIHRQGINDELIKRGLYFTVPLYYYNKKDIDDQPFYQERMKREGHNRDELRRQGAELLRQQRELAHAAKAKAQKAAYETSSN
jgi:hypothetical protein